MTMQHRTPHASPACALDEAPDAYRGYLSPAEIAAQIAALAEALEQAGRIEPAQALRSLLQVLPETAPAAGAADVTAAFDALLPRIKDDRLHAALKTIRAAL